MAEATPDADPATEPDDHLNDESDEFDESYEFDDRADDAQPFDAHSSDGQMLAAARRRHGALGGVIAAGMLGIDKVLGRKPREEVPVVVAAATEPVDIDAEGITVPLDEHTDVISPPIPRTAPKVAPARRRRR